MKYQVKESTVIAANVSQVRALVEDFSQWNVWSPWTIVEPDCKISISGAPGENGHAMAWDGKVIGSGSNTLVGKDEHKLAYDLKFLKPFKSRADVQFLFERQQEKTKVTWTMDSSMPFFLFFMVKTMKNWIGLDYQRGLRMLKELAEKGEISAKTTIGGLVNIEGFSYVGLTRTIPFSTISETVSKDFDKILHDIVEHHGKPAKHWVCLFPKMDMRNLEVTYTAAVSDENLKDINLGAEYTRGMLKKSSAFEIRHKGSYDFIGNGWSMGMMHLRAQKLRQAGVAFEQYWNSPKENAPENLSTSIYFPLKG